MAPAQFERRITSQMLLMAEFTDCCEFIWRAWFLARSLALGTSQPPRKSVTKQCLRETGRCDALCVESLGQACNSGKAVE